ncbi:MAG: type I restriction enzyme HsdR N-terminal domain-containing protein [Prevotellaceae bacterium]|jgi:type I site-specific restriction endonuclease|nr:type I restriction enzyme HsdR N-terminal domain-containing protein [Prevotellaceae bacterium]
MNYEHKIKTSKRGTEIFDPIRAKFVILTPEEWVRQNFLRYLIEEKNMPKSLIRVEMPLTLNGMSKRCDIAVYSSAGKALMAVECKASSIVLTQAVFEQLARYNLQLQVPYLAITNGLQHYFCKLAPDKQSYLFQNEIPKYSELISFDG